MRWFWGGKVSSDLGSDQAAAHLLNVGVAAALTSELDTADDAGDVTITLDFVEEETLFVFEVLVALAAVVMVRRDDLVLFHVFDGVEEGLTTDDGAGNLGWMESIQAKILYASLCPCRWGMD